MIATIVDKTLENPVTDILYHRKDDVPNTLETLDSMWRTENAMRSVEVTRARRSDALFQWQEDGREVGRSRGVTLSPVKLRNIPREILQPVRAGSSGTISHFAERLCHVANNEDRWRGLLAAGYCSASSYRAHKSTIPSCRILPLFSLVLSLFPLFVSKSERDLLALIFSSRPRSTSSTSGWWWGFWHVFLSLVLN